MRKWIESCIRKYDVATVFVAVATTIVVIELSLMRLFVPEAPSQESEGHIAMMKQVCSDMSVLEISREIEQWHGSAEYLSQRLSGDIGQWQKDTVNQYAFSDSHVKQEVTSGKPDIRSQQMTEADFAIKQLSLQSVMTGRKPLANINGKIYTVGDAISVMDGEIIMNIIAIGTDHAVVQLADAVMADETTRTIYLTRRTVTVSGDHTP